MEKFTFEELCLIRIFDTSNRDILRNELVSGLHYVDEDTEPDLIGLFGSSLEKLETLTDEEFTALSIYLDVDDFYAEGEEFEQ